MDQVFIRVPFASTGDRTAFPQTTDPAGSVSWSQGFGPDYELERSDPLSKAVPRPGTNYLNWALSQGLAQYQSFGTPEWISAADNAGVAFEYGKGARVRYRANPAAPWVVLESQVDANTLTPQVGSSWALSGVTGRVLKITAILIAGTSVWTPQVGMRTANTVAIGGGGAGSGMPATVVGNWSVAGGGGSGARSERIFTAAEIGVSQVITVGAGGVSNNGTSAVSGGTTSIGSLMTAPGGGGGTVGTGPYGTVQNFTFGRGLPAPAGAGGTFNFPGAQGFSGIANQGTPTAEGPSNGGAGANSPWSGTGGGMINSGSARGGNGVAPGAGGAGTSASAPSSGSVGVTARPGGDGAPGMAYIVEYS